MAQIHKPGETLVSMPSTSIPYSRVPHSSTLLLDYLRQYDRVSRFFSGSPFQFSNYAALADKLDKLDTPRVELAAVLARQNRALGCSEPTFANIDRLSRSGTYAVVTGQQVGLLSGPAFTLYKALTTIRLSQKLTEQGVPSVPVFWLATEDHDLKEVGETTFLTTGYELVAVCDQGEHSGVRPSVGQVKLTAAIESVLKSLEDGLPSGEARDRLLQDLSECYRPGVGWGEAFGRFLARLLSRWGVIFLDPLDEQVHRLALPAYLLALREATALRDRLLERSSALVRSGYHAQVRVAEDDTLLFLERNGSRVAVHQQQGSFLLDGVEEVPLAELSARAERTPLAFSPNALFRPIVQDLLLPVIAYVAGPSELAYLAQVQAIHESFGRPMPIVFLRAAFTLLDLHTQRLMTKYRLSVEDVWQGDEHLRTRIGAASFADAWRDRFEQSEKDLVTLLERLRDDVAALDPTLLDFLTHTREKMTFQMERLKGKISRAALARSDLLARHAREISCSVAPHKDLQERQLSGVSFLGRAGYDLLDRLLEHIGTDASDHQVLVY